MGLTRYSFGTRLFDFILKLITDASAPEKRYVVDACNAALQELVANAPRESFRKSDRRLVRAPVAIVLDVTEGSATLANVAPWAAWMVGCTVAIGGKNYRFRSQTALNGGVLREHRRGHGGHRLPGRARARPRPGQRAGAGHRRRRLSASRPSRPSTTPGISTASGGGRAPGTTATPARAPGPRAACPRAASRPATSSTPSTREPESPTSATSACARFRRERPPSPGKARSPSPPGPRPTSPRPAATASSRSAFPSAGRNTSSCPSPSSASSTSSARISPPPRTRPTSSTSSTPFTPNTPRPCMALERMKPQLDGSAEIRVEY